MNPSSPSPNHEEGTSAAARDVSLTSEPQRLGSDLLSAKEAPLSAKFVERHRALDTPAPGGVLRAIAQRDISALLALIRADHERRHEVVALRAEVERLRELAEASERYQTALETILAKVGRNSSRGGGASCETTQAMVVEREVRRIVKAALKPAPILPTVEGEPCEGRR